MELVRFQNVSKEYGYRLVLEDVSFQVMAGRKVGLVGPNGAGKTSILRMLLAEEPVSGGVIVKAPNVRIAYVPQIVEFADDETALGTILRDHDALELELRAAEQRLAAASGDDIAAAEEAYGAARDAFDLAGGEAARGKAIGMLDALGLADRHDESIATLSGGEKNVVSLVRALLAEPELLLLDEPANHLDFDGLAWLEGFLRSFRGAILIVSHNRYLLDSVVDEILHLERGRARPYAGNYSQYRQTLLQDRIAQGRDYAANQKRLAQLEALVQRFAVIASVRSDPSWGKRLRARRSQLERERRQAVERPTEDASGFRPKAEAKASHADIALQVRAYSKSFDDLLLFDDAELDISAGERVALVGPNGSGKTTLLRDVMARGAWDDPVIRIGPSLKVGFCAQEQELLNPRKTVFNQLFEHGTVSRDETYNVLARYLFGPNDYEKLVANLSGGERNRLQLALVLTERPNFLIMDEPTNHLDIQGREAVEDVLTDYKGTILLVSHDRYLLDKVAGRVVELRERKLVAHNGSFSEFWSERDEQKKREKARAVTRGRTRRRSRREAGRVNPQLAAKRDDDALAKDIAEAEGEKAALEQRVAAAYADSDWAEGARIAEELERHSQRLEELYIRWANEESLRAT